MDEASGLYVVQYRGGEAPPSQEEVEGRLYENDTDIHGHRL